VEVGTKGYRHLFSEECAQALVGYSPDYFANEITESDDVVAAGGSRFPPWFLSGEQFNTLVPVV